MSSNTTNYDTSMGGNGQSQSTQSYMLQQYLRADATVTERCSGFSKSSDSTKSREDKARDQIKAFDDIFAKSSGNGK
ncbi:uncharacterized protein F4822DRAFT_105448 [Hypoxylon trugodes]|uniref:uncharacterized protein n=1 Tax=Hypoxylon trugodes TaxID=326681 RepID=UPI00219DC243|nr:uncharacterized protein F4822DRAFT_105448 [Hypoxylon trugodes]KAI1391784.1 hypothetical protein F4822DRAFT_105448 [Hypoxylon trugodes]